MSILTDNDGKLWARDWRGAGRVIPEWLRWESEQAATRLVSDLVYFAKARQALDRLIPLAERAAAELARLEDEQAALVERRAEAEAERRRCVAAWREVKGTARAGALALPAAQSNTAVELVDADLRAIAHQLSGARERVSGMAQAVMALQKVEPPSGDLVAVFRQWLGLDSEPQAEPEAKRRGKRGK